MTDIPVRATSDMPAVVGLIFSKDRPFQLDGTIRSLKGQCVDFGAMELHVLFTTSTPFFAAQYRIVALEHPEVKFVREGEFHADVRRIAGRANKILFLVDDDLVLRRIALADGAAALDSDEGCLGFSYRLGRNTVYCYSLGADQALPDFQPLDEGIVRFGWVGAEGDFGYPLEVSASMYRTSDLVDVLDSLPFTNPNTLESEIAALAPGFAASRPHLAAYETSAVVSVPANLVQVAWGNRVGDRADHSVRSFAIRYSEGDRLDVGHYYGFVPNACHQELQLASYRDPSIPSVTVVIPCFEQATYLPEAVESVATQTTADWEIVIVDDGSPDDTAAVARSLSALYSDARIRLITQANSGLAAARNVGVTNARGRYILPLDADDRIAPTMIECALRELERDAGIAVVYTDLQQFGAGSAHVRAADFDPNVVPILNQLNYCALYRREVWEAVGGYNPNMRYGYEDWDFWVGAVEHGYAARRIPEPLLFYRIRSESMFTRARSHDAELRQQIRRNHPRLYTLMNRTRRFVRIKAKWWRVRLRLLVLNNRLLTALRGPSAH